MEKSYFVKEIKKQTKGKYEVSLEGGEPLVLYGKELSAYGIREEHFLSEETYERILKEVLNKRATKRAMYLLQKQDYTEKGLSEKLSQGGYPVACIEAAIEYVKGYHYVDDERFAENYIRFHQEKLSKRVLKQKLQAKGVSRELIEQQLNEAYETDELELAKELLRKRHYDASKADQKEKQRQYGFLARRGFSGSVISSALRMDFDCDLD